MKNNFVIKNNIVFIELNRRNSDKLYTLIDLDDFEIINKFENTFGVRFDPHVKSFYCEARYKNKIVRLHRMITNCPNGMVVDHINHDTLDNRKCNLRVITSQENNFNTRAKGYSWRKDKNKWAAYIRLNGNLKHLGYFDIESDARDAYICAKRLYHIYNSVGR